MQDVDTVTFFPSNIPFPEIKLDDFLRQTAGGIISILTAPPKSIIPTMNVGDTTRNALLELARILKASKTLPKLLPYTNPLPRVCMEPIPIQTLPPTVKTPIVCFCLPYVS